MPGFPFDLTGPQFLVFYILFAAAAIGGAVLLRRALEFGAAPKIGLADPYAMATLRGGGREALRVAVISLAERGMVEHTGGRLKATRAAERGPAGSPLEKEILDALRTKERSPRFFEQDQALLALAARYEDDLVGKGLLPGQRTRRTRRVVALTAIAVAGGMGAAKILVGLSRGRPVGFLVLLTIAACWLAWRLVTRPERTARGDAVLADARTLFTRLRTRHASGARGTAGDDAAVLAAVFGTQTLAGRGWNLLINDLAPPHRTGVSSWTGLSSASACGVVFACGSSSGSSCGSSCGGGCGGGCGGCGGS